MLCWYHSGRNNRGSDISMALETVRVTGSNTTRNSYFHILTDICDRGWMSLFSWLVFRHGPGRLSWNPIFSQLLWKVTWPSTLEFGQKIQLFYGSQWLPHFTPNIERPNPSFTSESNRCSSSSSLKPIKSLYSAWKQIEVRNDNWWGYTLELCQDDEIIYAVSTLSLVTRYCVAVLPLFWRVWEAKRPHTAIFPHEHSS